MSEIEELRQGIKDAERRARVAQADAEELITEAHADRDAAEARLDALVADLRGLPESWARAVHERYCGAPPSCGLSDRSSCEGTAGSDEIRLLRKALRAVLDKHAG
jgi:hypothetical protein